MEQLTQRPIPKKRPVIRPHNISIVIHDTTEPTDVLFRNIQHKQSCFNLTIQNGHCGVQTAAPLLTKEVNPPVAKPIMNVTSNSSQTQRSKHTILPIPSHYLQFRQEVLPQLVNLYTPYHEELLRETTTTCEDRSRQKEFELLAHQKIIRDYLQAYSPYRGVLYYHTFEPSKICTAIAMAEGMKNDKPIIVMTSKSDFFDELKKCGDPLFKKNQCWEKMITEGRPDLEKQFAQVLHLPVSYIHDRGGLWLINVEQSPNFYSLSTRDQQEIVDQLDKMMRVKYLAIDCHNLTKPVMNRLTENGTRNPFDHRVVVLDEAHTFVRAVTKRLSKVGNDDSHESYAALLYRYLLDAEDVRVVLLTGTPIVDSPHESGVLFNMLRGYMKTWTFEMKHNDDGKAVVITEDTIKMWMKEASFDTYDTIVVKEEGASQYVEVTENPFGFVHVIPSVETPMFTTVMNTILGGGEAATDQTLVETADETSEQQVETTNKTLDLTLLESRTETVDKTLDEPLKSPDESQRIPEETEPNPADGEHKQNDEGVVQSGGTTTTRRHKNRIQSSTKTIRKKPIDTAPTPNDKSNELKEETRFASLIALFKKHGVELRETKVTRFKALPDRRKEFESKFAALENPKQKTLYQKRILGLVSYYKSGGEHLMPVLIQDGDQPYHVVKVPMSQLQMGRYTKSRTQETTTKKIKQSQKNDTGECSENDRVYSRITCNFVFPDEIERPLPSPHLLSQKNGDNVEYVNRLNQVVTQLRAKPTVFTREGLAIHSPKFLAILDNILNMEHVGKHVVYSHFHSTEGIQLLQVILEQHGFAPIRLVKKDGHYDVEDKPEDATKMKYVLYTGQESAEEKAILMDIYNSHWKSDAISGMIRTKLEKRAPNNHLGEVVKLMLMTDVEAARDVRLKNTRFIHIVEPFWNMVQMEQMVGRVRGICSHQDLEETMRNIKVFLYLSVFRAEDIANVDDPMTTDEYVYDVAMRKKKKNDVYLMAIKESAIDSQLNTGDEPAVCYGAGNIYHSDEFATYPHIEVEPVDDTDTSHVQRVVVEGVTYLIDPATQKIHNYESFLRDQSLKEIGVLKNDRIVSNT